MFWDKVAGIYDLFEDVYNGKVNSELSDTVALMVDKSDRVLECACGTGLLTKGMARNCKSVIATDFSIGMLKKAKKKCRGIGNIKFRKADIMHIKCQSETFDKVVAGNVIHLLDEPYAAIAELLRVCKTGGKIIIPTYVNNENAGEPNLFVKTLEKAGAGFKCQFDYNSYQKFFAKGGYTDVEYVLVEGKMPCAIAIITKK